MARQVRVQHLVLIAAAGLAAVAAGSAGANLAHPIQQAQARLQAIDTAARYLPPSAAAQAATPEYPTPEAASADLVATVETTGAKVLATTSSAPAPGHYDVTVTMADDPAVARALTQLEQRAPIAAVALKSGHVEVTLRGTTGRGTDAH